LSINWTRLKTYVGKSRGSKAILRAYNHEEIRKLLQAARSERDRVIVLLMCSAGLRAGALPELKVSDLKYNPECNIYRILSYSESDSNHRYVTWCSPECANAINEMLDFRRRCGEVIKDSSPLIRKEFDKDSKKAVANAQELNVRAVERVLYMLAYDAGLRTKENKVTRLGDRHNTSQCHSLRRFFKTQATASGVDQLWSALLLGHGAKNSLEGRYDTPSEDMLLDAYIKAIPHLTIGSNEETRLKQKLGIVEAEKEQIRLTFEKRFEEYQASMNAKFDAINKMLAEAAKQQK
jgi:integrase